MNLRVKQTIPRKNKENSRENFTDLETMMKHYRLHISLLIFKTLLLTEHNSKPKLGQQLLLLSVAV